MQSEQTRSASVNYDIMFFSKGEINYEKICSGFFNRLNEGESFWVALPAKVIRQMAIGLIADTMCAGGIMGLNQKDLKRHNKKFYGDGKEKHNKSINADKK